MLNTVLFDMGGTLEDIWYKEETTADVMKKLQAVLRANGMEPGLYIIHIGRCRRPTLCRSRWQLCH